jgi:hypothetical protein
MRMPFPLPLKSIRYCTSIGVGKSTSFKAEVPLFFVFPPYMVNESKDLWHQQKINNIAPLLREQQAFYGLINAHNVLGRVRQVLKGLHCAALTIALCSAARRRNFAGPSNYNIRTYFIDSSRHATLLYQ